MIADDLFVVALGLACVPGWLVAGLAGVATLGVGTLVWERVSR